MTRDQGFRTGNVEYKFQPRLRLQLGLSMRRGKRALVLQVPNLWSSSIPAHILLVPKLGLQDPFDFSSEGGPLAAPGLLRPSPHMWKPPHCGFLAENVWGWAEFAGTSG